MQMPGRTYRQPNSNYRYGFNGKENDNDVKGEGNQQDYGMRISDPRLGRFLSVDPITNQYPELTPYQFASNRPIQGVDLDGLEFFPMNPKTPLGMTVKSIAVTSKNIEDKWNNSRGGQFANGLVNTAFGVAATVASVAYIGETAGAGAALGGATALMLSLGEIGMGVAQMTDAIAGKGKRTDPLHRASTVPGLIAFGTGSKYAPFIDAASALGGTFATSGGVKLLFKDGLGLKKAFSSFTTSPKILNILGGIDQGLDTYNFGVEAVNLINHFGTGSDTKVLKSQSLSYRLSYTAKSGDKLSLIAKRLNTNVDTLMKQNGITNQDDIKASQKISYSNTVTTAKSNNP